MPTCMGVMSEDVDPNYFLNLTEKDFSWAGKHLKQFFCHLNIIFLDITKTWYSCIHSYYRNLV